MPSIKDTAAIIIFFKVSCFSKGFSQLCAWVGGATFKGVAKLK